MQQVIVNARCSKNSIFNINLQQHCTNDWEGSRYIYMLWRCKSRLKSLLNYLKLDVHSKITFFFLKASS